MSLGERLTWAEAFEATGVDAVSLDDLLEKLVLSDSPKAVQIRVLTAYAAVLPNGIREEAVNRGLLPPSPP